MSYISQMLASDGFIITNKKLIRELGLHQAVLIGELCSQYNFWKSQNKLDDNDSFYCTQDKMEENTGLSARQQRSEFKKLQDSEIISIHRRGLPAVNFYQIHFDKLTEILEKDDTVKDALLDSTKSNIQTLQNVTSNITKCNLSNKENNKKEKESYNYIEKNCIQSDCGSQIEKDTNAESFLGSVKKIKNPSRWEKILNLIDDFTDNKELKECLTLHFKECMRKQIANGYEFQEGMAIGKLKSLKKITTKTDEQIKVVMHSLERGYPSYYDTPLKQANSNYKDKSYRKSNPAKTDCGLAIKETNEDAERNNKLWKELEESGKSAVY